MAFGDPYATATELKDRLGMTTTTAAEDARLAAAVATASQEVDAFCSRTFNSSGTASERQYTASSREVVFTDDFHTDPTSIKAVEITGDGITITTPWLDGEYQLEPSQELRAGYGYNAPRWLIRNLRPVAWPVGPRKGHILVTATWGWEAVPAAVKEATLLIAEDYFKLKEAPFGVVNWGEFGPFRVQHNRRAVGLLKNFRRGGAKVG